MPPASPLDGTYSGSWDCPAVGSFGTVSFKVAGSKFEGTARDTSNGKDAVFIGTVERLMSGDTFRAVWRYTGGPAQPFTGTVYETPPGWSAQCGLDDGMNGPKRVVSPLTMALGKD